MVHPLHPLSAEEIEAATAACERLFGGAVAFSSVSLVEPPRGDVDAFEAGAGPRPPRRLLVSLLERRPARAHEVVVEAGAVVSRRHVPGVQPSFAHGEYELCEEAVRGDERLRGWCAERGVDVADVLVEAWASGWFGPEDDPDRRLVRPLLYLRSSPGAEHSNPFGRPLDGLLPVVDLVEGRVVRWARWAPDHPVPPAGDEHAEFDRSFWPAARRLPAAAPIVISQPEGAAFSVSDGNLVEWQRFRFRVGFTQREGLVLHGISFCGRSVAARLSYNEMVVPYGDPRVPNVRKNAFDAGEDGLGNSANSLELGCDCVGRVRYFDGCVVNRLGRAVRIPRAVCMHEEDDGVLFTHVDWRTGRKESRRSRRLVVQFTATVANYDYIFAFHLRLDGAVEGLVKMTGILSTSSVPPGSAGSPHGTMVAPQLNAPIHHHFFVVRLDAAVDGPACRVDEVEVRADPPGAANPRRNAFRAHSTPVLSEDMGGRDVDNRAARHWLVSSATRRNRTGARTAYRLLPGPDVRPLMHPTAPVLRRASFLRHQLWVTQSDPARRFASGDYPNQRRGSDGVAEWALENRPLVDVPVSLWYCMGFTHVVAVENWPIMNVETVGFTFAPFGFHDANPCLAVAPASDAERALSVEDGSPYSKL